MTQDELKMLYAMARQALADQDYEEATTLLKKILLLDENYRDASQLLAQIVRRKRRQWYRQPLLWGGLGLVVLVIFGIILIPRVKGYFASQPLPPTITSTITPTTAWTPTRTPIPSQTPTRTIKTTPTVQSSLLTWKRISLGQEFPRLQIISIAFDPVDPDVIYLGTQPIGIYKTINGGESWQSVSSDIQMTEVSKIIINPQDPRIILVQAKQGLYRSPDGGESWEVSLPGADSLIIDVLDPSKLYAWVDGDASLHRSLDHGTSWIRIPTSKDYPVIFVHGNTWYSKVGETLYYSEDEGQTWTSLPQTPKYQNALHYQTDGQGREWLLAGRSERGEVRYRSSDNGKTWQEIRTCILPAATPTNTALYAICSQQLRKTLDGGLTWEYLSPVQEGATALAVSPISENTVAVAGYNGVEITRDGGRTWRTSNNGIGNVPLELMIDPRNPSTWYAIARIVDEGFDNGQVNKDFCNFYRSSDGGTTWQLLQNEDNFCNLALDGSGNLYQTEYNYIFRSTNGGQTWLPIPRPKDTDASRYGGSWVIPQPDRDGTLFFSFLFQPMPEPDPEWNIHFWVSHDDGKSWERLEGVGINLKAGVIPIRHIGFSNDPNKVYLYTYLYYEDRWSGSYFSSDGGTTWTWCDLGQISSTTTVTDLLVDPLDNERLFAATNGEGVLVVDGCKSTRKLNLSAGMINTMVVDPEKPEVFYAGGVNGAYVSFDGAEQWSLINNGLLGAPAVYSIVTDSQGNVYAATPHGIFRLEGR